MAPAKPSEGSWAHYYFWETIYIHFCMRDVLFILALALDAPNPRKPYSLAICVLTWSVSACFLTQSHFTISVTYLSLVPRSYSLSPKIFILREMIWSLKPGVWAVNRTDLGPVCVFKTPYTQGFSGKGVGIIKSQKVQTATWCTTCLLDLKSYIQYIKHHGIRTSRDLNLHWCTSATLSIPVILLCEFPVAQKPTCYHQGP